MLEGHDVDEESGPTVRREPVANSLRAYDGPDRRRARQAAPRWLLATLDEIDYGILLLDERDDVLYANHAAMADLDGSYPLVIAARRLRARSERDAPLLRDALVAARERGFRKLLSVGDEADRAVLALVPLQPSPADFEGRSVMVLLGKRTVCEKLSVEGFARSNCLTTAETRVLVALCDGHAPHEAAEGLGVAISTIRTHIIRIRAKTGAHSIRDLVRQVAVLPPLVNVLRGVSATWAHGL